MKLTTEKQQKECFFAALVGFPTTKTVKNTQNWAKQPQKLKGIPLEQAQMYGQYGIESVGLKEKTKKQHTKKAAT